MKRILVVDDVPLYRRLLRSVFTATEGFVVAGEAGDGETAIDLARDARPDVIVLDLAMPGMDGLEALPRLKEAAPGCLVLVLSGFEAARMASAALSRGANGYLEKGASPEEIVAAVRALEGGTARALA